MITEIGERPSRQESRIVGGLDDWLSGSRPGDEPTNSAFEHLLDLYFDSSFSFGEARIAASRTPLMIRGRRLAVVAVWEGDLQIVVDDRPITLKALECALLLSQNAIGLCPFGEGAAQVAWCETLLAVDAPVVPRQRMTASEIIRTLMRLGIEAAETPCSGRDRLRRGLGIATISAFMAQLDGPTKGGAPVCIGKAIAFIREQFAEPIDLSRLAAAAGVTREHLATAFKKHCGTTPMRFLWSVRTKHALRLLETTGYGLSDIADRTGFKSPYHLSRQVKRLTGRSPIEHRRQRET